MLFILETLPCVIYNRKVKYIKRGYRILNEIEAVRNDHPLVQMDISKEVVRAFDWMGFKNLTGIQQKCIPLMMEGHDIIAIAPTGTGKTLGFGIPMLEYINLEDPSVQEVVLAPTRELAQQIADELTNLAHYIKGLKIAVIYGGQPFGKQMSALARKPQILVATPGPFWITCSAEISSFPACIRWCWMKRMRC